MTTGFVKLRRGISEHLKSGRIDSDEFAAYVHMIVEADHRTGVWRGSGVKLAADVHWYRRKAFRVLSSLRDKGYISFTCVTGMVGNYAIKISKYHPSAGVPKSTIRMSKKSHHRKSTTKTPQLIDDTVVSSKKTPIPHCPKSPTNQKTRSKSLQEANLLTHSGGQPPLAPGKNTHAIIVGGQEGADRGSGHEFHFQQISFSRDQITDEVVDVCRVWHGDRVLPSEEWTEEEWQSFRDQLQFEVEVFG